MSSYERYDKTSAHYDRTRWPIGAEIIVGCLAQGRAALAQMTVLDAGCGTGNYARALLPHVQRIEALDRSDGMLEVAGRKLAAAIEHGRVILHRGEIDACPLPTPRSTASWSTKCCTICPTTRVPAGRPIDACLANSRGS
jgi:ubiquinone/menaquinone biosynthesis C-methylase UbiE